MLQFMHVGKRFGSWWAPVRYSLSIQPGELVWLSGPPGVGKSVLVRMALGSIAPTTGSVNVNGVNPHKVSHAARQQIRRSISAVLDDEPLLDLSAESWFALGLWCAGRSWAASIQEARQVLRDMGLDGLAAHPYSRLARGHRFTLSLARALARKPHSLLVDWAGAFAEPLPDSLGQELARYVKGGGAGLIVGESTPHAAQLGGRQERMEPERLGGVP